MNSGTIFFGTTLNDLMVYLVDDDVDDIQIFQDVLAINSYKGPVKAALNGQVLMDELSSQNGPAAPQVIVLDLNMPLKDGFETLVELKSHPSLKGIPVIILTSSTNISDRNKCLELGCDQFFNKPHSLVGYNEIALEVKKCLAGQADG